MIVVVVMSLPRLPVASPACPLPPLPPIARLRTLRVRAARRRRQPSPCMVLAPLRVTPPPPRPLHVHVHVGRSPHTTKTSATATFSDSSGASKLEDTSYNRLAGCGLGAACHGGGAPPIRGMGSCAALSRSRPRPYSSFPEATTAGSSSHGLRPGQETCRRPACRGAYAR